MKYALIAEYAGLFAIALMCRVLGVSRSGFYRWLDRDESDRKKRRNKMESLIKDTYEEFEAAYGAPRITKELNELGYPCSLNYVAQIMAEQGIKARNGKGFKYSKNSLTVLNVSDNLLWRDFSASKPNEKWTTDITYIWVKDKWLYLATVMDLFSRRIVGWSLDESMTEALVKDAIQMAFSRRKATPGLIVHSDRGTQYRAQGYVDYLRSNGCRLSMSRKGNCWDNAPMESFFSRLKVELVYAKNYSSIEEAKSGIFAYIEIFYNRKRRHSANDDMSPIAFEEKAAMAA
ncbi:transposase [Thalassolituus oleivorans]|uniref:IS3 family transposase n=1 Tax=Thalassolituus oleivorans TaxID=187493 RepID=UPI0009493470|nr:IS3 family transposase [Thalassolituus oleivorans]APR66589.1 transposase [Thalassolituus oleivorans]